MPRRLSPQRKRFVEAYLGPARGNGTKAALAAGYSEHTAGVQASQLLKSPAVAAAVARGEERIAKGFAVTIEELDQELAAVVRAQPAKPPTYSEKLKGIELAGKRLRLWDDHSQDSRIIVNVGFLALAAPQPTPANTTTIDVEVMPPRLQDDESGE